MSTELAPRHEHLGLHRRMILLRSVAAGMAGATPVPFLDDWLASLVRRRAVRRIADARRVDLSEEAVRTIADGRVPPPSWRAVFKGTAMTLFLRHIWRRALLLLAVAKRADEVGKAFSLLTLVDHYCARVHVGGELQAADALRLRDAIDEAMKSARGGLTGRLLKRGLFGAGRAALRAPLEIADAATGGAVRRLLAREDEARAEEVVEEALERAASREKSFLARAARGLEAELAEAGGAWQGDLIEAFEAAWRRKR